MTNENYWDYEKVEKQFEALVEASVVAPQFITKDGKPVVVMVSVEKYQELTQTDQVR